MKAYLKTVAKRFFRAFLAGGLAQISLTLTTTPINLATLEDLKKWGTVLAVAFVTGGVMALDKLLRYDKEKV